ncbi:hypothetical protein [Pseudobacter ginsenosidimutans]|uniref:Uncharacterized protein n=1 Tax=Pseudobacter ginsenosidimutans TaxID=661488 RepID=A0A4Q7N521_9BACT|nr:hypothetical protein [Pseudobacter ginsenosidimutans]RZS76134.1 hypothetical protein EV199_2012 [Pseudobacter ginsenosidimutans]
MKPVIYFVLLTSLVLTMGSSCKKGDTGPAGTANVFFSEWFTPTPYIKDTVFGVWGFKYNKPVPAITQKILDSGSVLVYGKLLGYNPAVWPTNQVSQLPISITYMQGGHQVDIWEALVTPGNIRIRFTNDHNIYTSIATQHQFRYVIIPGGMPTAHLANMKYSDVASLYNLPE